MSFRTVVVKSRAKLDFRLNYLVCRGEVEQMIHLSEITTLILESTSISITAALLSELVKRKIKVLFCDEKHLPFAQLMPLYDNYHSSKQIENQIRWSDDIKQNIWRKIVCDKITNQRLLLLKFQKLDAASLLERYCTEVTPGDTTNREGHAAKVYFNSLFEGDGRRSGSFQNSALNYGYAILLSAFCREITESGCLTQLGIWHKNEFNPYNLACDFMEPYRVIVDELVLSLDENDLYFKPKLANILNSTVFMGGKRFFLDAAISLSVKSLIKALNSEKISHLTQFESYELPLYENHCHV